MDFSSWFINCMHHSWFLGPGSWLTLARLLWPYCWPLRPPWCECLPLSASEPPLNLPPATQILFHWDFPQGLCSSTQTPAGGGLAVNPAHHGAKSACHLQLPHLHLGRHSGLLFCCSGQDWIPDLPVPYPQKWLMMLRRMARHNNGCPGVTLASFRGDCAKEWATKALCVGDDEQWNAGLCWKPVCHVTPVTPHPPRVLAVKRQPLLCIFTHPPGT